MRAGIKLFLFGALCLVTYILLMVRFAMPDPYRCRWRAFVHKTASRIGLFILGIRLTVKGKSPRAPFILVTNHLSYVDMFILASQSGPLFVAKHETASWPLIGTFIKSLGTIFINRQNAHDSLRVGQLIEKANKMGEGVVLFPEGTSSMGMEVLAFRAALFIPAALKGTPVWAGSIRYKTPPGNPPAYMSVCWWGDMEFWPHWMSLLRLPCIEAELVFADGPVSANEPRQLAKALENKVKELFQPTLRGDNYELHPVN